MYIFYEVKDGTTYLHSISESFDMLVNEAKKETVKENNEIIKSLEKKLETTAKDGEPTIVNVDEDSIWYMFGYYRYQRPDHTIGVLELPKPVKNGFLYYHVENGMMHVKDVAEQFEDLFDGAKFDTLEDIGEFHDDWYSTCEEIFSENTNKYEYESWDMGLHANKETKIYTYWSHYDSAYEIAIDPLPKMFKKILL